MANIDDLYKKSFGQLGSVFTSVSGAITPPTNKVFIAITFLADTTLDSSGGLIAATDRDDLKFPTTLDGSGSAVYTQAGGGDDIDSNDLFPAGVTIFGRWTEIDLNDGMVMAYIGE